MDADNDNKRDLDGPALAEQDWDAIESGDLTPSSAPENGDIRYEGGTQKSGELDGEDDDNPEQESDEALPNDREERALRRVPGKESGLFDQV